MAITTINHPKSGETFAVELSDKGRCVRVAGPLHHSDPTDEASLRALLDNARYAEDDAAWLNGQLGLGVVLLIED